MLGLGRIRSALTRIGKYPELFLLFGNLVNRRYVCDTYPYVSDTYPYPTGIRYGIRDLHAVSVHPRL